MPYVAYLLSGCIDVLYRWLLLGQAVESAEAPNEFRAIDGNNPPVWKAILENFLGPFIPG